MTREVSKEMGKEEILQALSEVKWICRGQQYIGDNECNENCPFVYRKNKTHRCVFKTPPADWDIERLERENN